MKAFRYIWILLAMLWLPPQIFASSPDNISITIGLKNEPKAFYSIGDEVSFKVIAIQTGKYCSDGIDKIRILTRGMKIESQTEWKKLSEEKWEKELTMKVSGSKSGKLQLTAYRKTDKGTVVESYALKLK